MDTGPINVTDIIILVVLLLSGVFAFMRGFVHEVLAVGAWVGAAVATIFGYEHVFPFFQQMIAVDFFSQMATGISIFLVVLIILSVLAHLISRRVQDSSLGALDRLLGFVFGLARGVLLVLLAWIGLNFMLKPEEQPQWVQEAHFKPYLDGGSAFLVDLVPEDLRDTIQGEAEGAGQSMENGLQQGADAVVDSLLQQGDSAPPEGYDSESRQELEGLLNSDEQPQEAGQ